MESRLVNVRLLVHAMRPRPGRRLIIIMPIIMARALALRDVITKKWRRTMPKPRPKARSGVRGLGRVGRGDGRRLLKTRAQTDGYAAPGERGDVL